MQFRTIAAIAALAVSARAQAIEPDVQQSVLLVLAQAIPTDVASYALASSSAFAAEMASSLADGNTPTWYQALPTDVKSLLPQIYPGEIEATPTPTPSSSYIVSTSSKSSTAMVTPYPTSANSTMAVPTMSAPGTVSMGESATTSATSSASEPEFTGAAARLPNAAVGAGLGAALGFLGMLAL